MDVDWVGVVIGTVMMTSFAILAASMELLGRTLEKKRQDECGDETR